MNSASATAPATWKDSVRTRAPFLWTAARAIYWPLKRAVWYARKTHCGIEQARNIVIDWKFGGYCGGSIPTKFASMGANGTSSADYYQLDKLFGPGGVKIAPGDVLVDVGCGKGRIVNYWLYRGYKNRMYGLELDPLIAGRAAERLRRFANVSIVPGDAIQNLPDDGTLFFLFNPFGPSLMAAFKERAKAQFGGRPIRILYFRPRSANVFLADPQCEVQALELNTFYKVVLITLKSQAVSSGAA